MGNVQRLACVRGIGKPGKTMHRILLWSCLIAGALPFWQRLRSERWAQASLAGANASVVGVLLAALYSPVFTEGVRDARDVAAGLVAFGLLEHGKAPPWLIVIGLAVLGQTLLG